MRRKASALAWRALAVAVIVTAGLCCAGGARAEEPFPDGYLIRPTLFDQVGTAIRRAAEATAARFAFNNEVQAARARFFAGCTRGVRDPAAEADFANLLLQKDIYYLSLYLFEGVTPAAQKRVNATETLTGGPLDGGLTAQGLFSDWTDAVRRAMGAPPSGQFWLPPSPADALTAIQSASAQYAIYQQTRDRHEFDRWRTAQRATAGTPANTPEQRASRYDEYVLGPGIQKAVDALPEEQQTEARSRLGAWAAEVHQAIVGYETMEATPDLVADLLRAGNFPEDIVQSAKTSLLDTSPAGQPAANAAAVAAVARAVQQLDARRDPRMRPPEPNLRVLDLRLHDFAFARGAGRLTADEAKLLRNGASPNRLAYLMFAARPPYRCCTSYDLLRNDVITGAVYREPPSAQPGRDSCTGAALSQVRSAVIGPAPDSAAASTQTPPAAALVSHDVTAFDPAVLGSNNFRAARAMGTLFPNGADKWTTYNQVVDRIVKSGQYRTLNCTYGDSRATYHFWSGAVPPYYAQLTLAVTIGGMAGDAARLGTRPVAECPPTEAGAQTLQQSLISSLDRPNTAATKPEETVLPFSHERIGAVSKSVTTYRRWENAVKPENTGPFNAEVDRAMAARQQVLECDYFSYGMTNDFFYWYRRAPANVARLIGLGFGYNGALSQMGTTGRDSCPATLGNAIEATNKLTQEGGSFVKY